MLRLEKGHIIVGQDTDGLTHPYEADMAWAIAKNKPFFVGKRSIEIQNAKGLTRKLVGFTLVDRGGAGARGMPPRRPRRATSSAASPRPCARRRSARSSASPMWRPTRPTPASSFDIRVDGGRMVQGNGGRRSPSTIPKNKRQEM